MAPQRLSAGRGGPVVGQLERRRLLSAISFQAAAAYAAGEPGPDHVAVGDFNNDAILDLVVTGHDPAVWNPTLTADTVRVLLGRGDGTFLPPAAGREAGSKLSAVAVGDFNGDGRLDVAASDDRPEGMVHVLLGNGDGSLQAARSFHSGADSKDLAVADFNDDGRPDLAVADASPWSPFGTRIASQDAGALLLGNGDGTFQRERFIDTARRPQHFVEAGDVNGDGHADTVFAQVVIGPGDLVAPESLVFASVADLDQPSRPPTTVPAAITGLALADLDGDGRLDVAASGVRDFLGVNGVAATLRGLGDGQFAPAELWFVGSKSPTDVAVADFNADGRPDLAVAGDDPRFMRPTPVYSVMTLANLGGGQFGDGPRYFHLHARPAGLAAGRFNGDRLPDVAAALPDTNQVDVLVNNTRALRASGRRVAASAGVALSDVPLARFDVTGGPASASDFRATVFWRDGTPASQGRIVANDDGSFGVVGSHTYARAGIYRVLVVIDWPGAGLRRMTLGWVRVGRP